MLHRDRKHRHSPPAYSAAPELEQWRTAAQRVAPAWNAWLAVDWSDRARAYGVYLEALAEEELAAQRVQGHDADERRQQQRQPRVAMRISGRRITTDPTRAAGRSNELVLNTRTAGLLGGRRARSPARPNAGGRPHGSVWRCRGRSLSPR